MFPRLFSFGKSRVEGMCKDGWISRPDEVESAVRLYSF